MVVSGTSLSYYFSCPPHPIKDAPKGKGREERGEREGTKNQAKVREMALVPMGLPLIVPSFFSLVGVLSSFEDFLCIFQSKEFHAFTNFGGNGRIINRSCVK